jgi:acetyltransferase
MTIVIRTIRPSDAEELSRFYRELSPESLNARFLGSTRGISAATARAFCTLDHMHDEGLVALADDFARQRIVGHVCLLEAGDGAVEIGICVADRLQGLGIGRRLFERAITWATERGYTRITATCATNNSRVLALLSSAPHGAETTLAIGGTVDVTIPLLGHLPESRESWPTGALAALACQRRSHRRIDRRRSPLHMFRLAHSPVPAKRPTRGQLG